MKNIKNYEDYIITTCGKVFSLKNNKIKELKQTLGKDGYFYVSLSCAGKVKKFKTHRIVAESFISKPNEKDIVNHIDEVKTNNSVCNLEWCNKKENLFHGSAYQRMLEKQKSKSVAKMKCGEILKIYRSLREVETDGYCRRHVKKCCEKIKNYNSHKGFNWEYV